MAVTKNTKSYILTRNTMLTERTKSFIEKEWISSGKQHNIICSQCFKPGNLMLCSTCCRSYHYICLVSPPSGAGTASWSCPACQERQAALNSAYDQQSDPEIMTMIQTNCDAAAAGDQVPTSASDPTYAAAKEFLANYGLANNQALTADFLRGLQELIAKAELVTQKETELRKLRLRHSQLMNEIIRSGARSESPGPRQSHESQQIPVYNSQQGASVASSYLLGRNEVRNSDVSDKSWDRIISEAF